MHAEIRTKINLSNENYKSATDVHRRYQEFNKNDQVMLRHRVERLPPGTWKKVHAKRMGPFRIKKKVSANAYELDLPSDMGIGPVFNVADLTSYHGPLTPSSISSSSANPVEPTLVPSLPVPPAPPLVSSQHTADGIEDVLDERVVSTRRGEYRQFLVKWSDKPHSDCTWISRDEFHRIDPALLERYDSFLST